MTRAMPFALSKTSRRNLQGVHPDLIRVVERAISATDLDFRVNEGLRSKERQAQIVASGASHTTRSRHLTGHAVDLVALLDGAVRWDWPLYIRLANVMRQAADLEKVPLERGGNWRRIDGLRFDVTSHDLSREFPDGPHYKLPRSDYP